MASDDDKKKSNPNTKTITTTTTEEEEKTPATTDAAKSDDKDTKKKDVEEAQVEVEAPEAEEVVKEETAIEAKAAEATDDEEDGNNNDNQTMPDTPSNKRRFFPRVKHLLTREWEYVSTLLDCRIPSLDDIHSSLTYSFSLLVSFWRTRIHGTSGSFHGRCRVSQSVQSLVQGL
jgi:hypothetical protein